MSIFSALNSAYDRLAQQGDVPPFGYSSIEADFCIVIRYDGSPAFEPVDLRTKVRKKPVGLRKNLPTPLIQRTSGIAPNFLWDKTAYSLGITAGNDRRTTKEHAEFISFHKVKLENLSDKGLSAFRNFIVNWNPQLFEELKWPEEMKDKNIVFALEDEYREVLLHERPAAKELWQKILKDELVNDAVCLIKGTRGRVARSHPPIKRVWGAQSSGAFIVSFNLDASTSYGHKQGNNAPVSERAAFAYTTVLNKFLRPGSPNRIQIGDTSTIFWADGSEAEVAEGVMSAIFGEAADKIDERSEAQKIKNILEKMRQGIPLEDFNPDIAHGVRFYVLGLAPNAARISVRFWLEGNFGTLAQNYQKFLADMAIDPPPRDDVPPLRKYLLETAVRRKSKNVPPKLRDEGSDREGEQKRQKRENVPPKLAGDWMRAILAGTPYPLTLMSTILMRLRADKTVNALRVAMLKAVLIRNFNKEKEAPVALDINNDDPAYLLGRLFAVLEKFQKAALGNINRTIRDGYFGTAMTAPSSVFSRLIKLNSHHRSKAIREKPNWAKSLEIELADITNALPPNIPSTLSLTDQGVFALGYFHQFNYRKATNEKTTSIRGTDQ